jgi:anaerobic magnesium-protoporphyrin IX monomethyl ester cyclase
MKIRLIEPDAPSVHIWSQSYFVRLGLPIIGAALKAHGHDVVIYHPHLAPIDWDDVHSADLVGLSSTTSTTPAAFAIADDLRWRGIPVVHGGSHVTFRPEEALEHAAYVARGEGGEQLMLELIEALEGRRELESIAGLSFLRDGVAVHNPLREPCADLDTLPFPDLTLIKGYKRLSNIPIMTSWGCPFACNFCSVTAMFGRKYRFRSAESVVAEIKEKKPKRIFFYDDNFAANKRRLKRLLQMMIDEGLTMSWGAQVRTDVSRDPELLDLMRRSGCEFVALGLESVNQETLDHFEKSQTVDDIERAIAVLHQYGIRSHGMFVLGGEHDMPHVVRDTVSFALRNRIDTVMLNILTPLPGTQQFAELEAQNRLITKDWQYYDAQHVVFRPRKISARRLLSETLHGNRRFYSTPRAVGSVLTLLTKRDKTSWDRMLERCWLWWYSRVWHLDSRNRAHERMLRGLRPLPPRPETPPSRAARAETPAPA